MSQLQVHLVNGVPVSAFVKKSDVKHSIGIGLDPLGMGATAQEMPDSIRAAGIKHFHAVYSPFSLIRNLNRDSRGAAARQQKQEAAKNSQGERPHISDVTHAISFR